MVLTNIIALLSSWDYNIHNLNNDLLEKIKKMEF